MLSHCKLLLVISLFLTGCSNVTNHTQNTSTELEQFAYANYLIAYLDSKGYDSSDARSIAGGIVEVSDISLDTFQDIALRMRKYQSDIKTKKISILIF